MGACTGRCIASGFSDCCAGEKDSVGDSSKDIYECHTTEPDCVSKRITAWGACSEASAQKTGRATEVDKKFETLKTWLDGRTNCSVALNACTGSTTCNLTTCKPEMMEFTYTVKYLSV